MNLSAEKLTGPIYGKVGDNLVYTFTVKNNSSSPSGADYEVYLYHNRNVSLAAPQPGVSLPAGGTHNFSFTWNTTDYATTNFYDLTAVVLYGSIEDETGGLRVDLLPTTAEFKYVGDNASTTWDRFFPISYRFETNVSQTIYLENQIGFTGTITHLAWDFRGHGDVPANIPVEIWMGHTTNSTFSTGNDWVPTSDMIRVFQGFFPVDFSGISEVAIRLNTPFVYTGGNLVVMAYKPFVADYYDEANGFKTTNVGVERSLVYTSMDTPIDLGNLPPAGRDMTIPNIKFMLSNPVVEEIDVVIEEPRPVFARNSLLPNYPNPFNPSTTISFDNVVEGNVRIDIFNVKGQRITTLTNQHYGIGLHKLVWDGRDDFGTQVGSGVYLYRMTSENHTETRRMIMMK
jgi:hypothetical protein